MRAINLEGPATAIAHNEQIIPTPAGKALTGGSTRTQRPGSHAPVKEPFDSPDWIFETKLDGFRAIAVIDSAGKARIWSRNRLPLEQKFPTIGAAVNQLSLRSTILDGEIVALDGEGVPRFQLLQRWQKRPTAPVCFYLFDLLWCDGRDITARTVLQ